MQTTENVITKTLKNPAHVNGVKNENGELSTATDSIPITENGTQKTVVVRHESRTSARYADSPIRVSEQQYLTMREETLNSLNLLNSCGNALLGAMESIVPHKDSPRQMGEYTGQMMRQLSKSVCDIVQTKCNVVRQIHSIVRDDI